MLRDALLRSPHSPNASVRYGPAVQFCAFVVLLSAVAGCPSQGPRRLRYDPVPIADAIALVNTNSLALQTTLKARAGHASGYFTEADGTRRKYDLDAALLVLPPRCLRLDLSVMGKSQLIFGSNANRYWVVQPAAHALTWGRHDQPVPPRAGDLIIRPDLIVEAIGIQPLPENTIGDGGPIQRITDDYQQLIFIDFDENLQGYITKEYWLDRYDPRLVGRIVFRDPLGEVVMDSRIGAYAPIGDGGPLIPHRIEVNWPANDSHMLFTAGGWSRLPMVDESHPGFAFPLDRGQTFKRIVDIDVELEETRHPTPPPVIPPETDCELPRKPLPSAQRPLLAVLDFDITDAIQETTGADFAEACRTTIRDTNQYVVMDREAMIARLGWEARTDASACTDAVNLVDCGRGLAVQKLVHGRLRPNGDAWTLTLTLLDASAGSVEAKVNVALVGQPDRLIQTVPAITCELLRKAMAEDQ